MATVTRAYISRDSLVADVVSDIGTFMQSVGAAWLMVSLGAGPIWVALTQSAASLPYFLLALPAGSAATSSIAASWSCLLIVDDGWGCSSQS